MAKGDFGEFGDLREIKLPDNPLRFARVAILGFLVLIAVFTSVYTVDPEELGVVTQFGAYRRIADPGLNFKIPFGIESVMKVAVQRQQKEEFGFRTLQATSARTRYSTQDYAGESLMLTGDLNAASVEWVVQYRIVDPYNYLFKVRGVRETLRDMSEAVVRRIVGDRTVNEVLTVGRQEVATSVEAELQALCDQYENGIRIEQVVLQDVNPPDEVKPSFNEVNEAQQERERLINQALAEYNKVVPKASGQAQQTIQEARGYYLDRVNRARGDSARFASLYDAYQASPEVTRKRMYLETMNDVMSKAGRTIIMDSDAKGVLPLLNLDGLGSSVKEAK